MKILTLMMLMVVGCGNSSESVVGTYEQLPSALYPIMGNSPVKLVLLENGKVDIYKAGTIPHIGNVHRWNLVGNEVHIDEYNDVAVYKIHLNGNLTEVAFIHDRQRFERPKDQQPTWGKIK